MNQTINKRKIILISVAVLIIAVVIVRIFFAMKEVRENQKIDSIDPVAKDTEKLNIQHFEDVSLQEVTVYLNFKKKKLISEGKYGFRKKVKLEKRSAVSLAISGESQDQCKDVRVGLFRDQELTEPIEEGTYIDWGDESYEEAELGIERKIEKDEDGQIFVDAGTYYVGLYTTNPFDEFKVEYEGWYGALKTNYQLKEGEENGTSFFVDGPEQTVYFKIHPRKTGKIRVEFYVNGGAAELCDEKKRTIAKGKSIYTDHLDGTDLVEKQFNVEGSKVYYIKVHDMEVIGSSPMDSFGIDYRYIKK